MDLRALTDPSEGMYYDDDSEDDSSEDLELAKLPAGDYFLNEEDEERLNILRAMTYDKKEY